MTRPAPRTIRELPFRHRAVLALLPSHVRDEHERELLLSITDEGARPSWLALVADVLRAAPAAHGDIWRQDLRHAVRQIRRSPGFALIAIVTLSLGLGGNLTFFTLVDGVLFQPLPWAAEDRLVSVSEENIPRNQRNFGVSAANFRDYTRDTSLFRAATAFQVRPATMRAGESHERVITAAVSGAFFNVFLERPRLGRRLDPSDDVVGGNAVVVSEAFHTRFLGGDPAAIDRDIEIDGQRLRVVGVMPRSFAFPSASVEIWRPLAMPESEWQRRGARYLRVVVRLRDDASVSMAAQSLSRIAASLSASHPDTNTDWTVLVRDLRSAGVDSARAQLYLIWAAGALVLLVAVANVAGLFIARAVTRQREFAVRGALGARTGRVARQVLTEALVLTVVGTAVGLAIAAVGLSWIRIAAAGVIPRISEVALGWRSAGVSFGIAVVAAMALSAVAVPTMQRIDLWGALGGGRGGVSPGRWRLLRAIVAGEVALACFVLIGASLVTRSLRSIFDQPMGFEPAGVTTFRVEAPFRFRTDQPLDRLMAELGPDQRRVVNAFDALLGTINELPGVQSSGAINRIPLSGNFWVTSVDLADRPSAAREDREQVWVRPVTPGYLETMGTRLLRGRAVEQSDRAGAERVVVIDEAFASRVWGASDPVGRHLILDGPPDLDNRARIVGVVESVHMNRLDAEMNGAMYVPFAQSFEGFFPNWGLDLVVRGSGNTMGDPAQMAQVRRLVRTYLPDAVMFNVSTMNDVVAASIADRRFQNLVLGLFSALSLLLAAVGVGGALTLIVRERQKELAIRQALGARAARVWWDVQARGLSVAGAGALAGAMIALGGAKVFSSLVYGIPVRDPLSFLLAPLSLCVATFVAVGIPATRAIRISPISALRET